jgi:hypothetical protein
LRAPLKGALLKKNTDLIENDGAKSYRISTPPDNITYNQGDLLKHPAQAIKSLAKKLPQEATVNGKRSRSKK